MIAKLHASPLPRTQPTCNNHHQKGSMAQLGMWRGVVDTANLEQEGAEKVPSKTISGLTAFLLWCVRARIPAGYVSCFGCTPRLICAIHIDLHTHPRRTKRRAAYWTKSVSLVNKILIPMGWFRSWLFGRDICRF